MPNSIVHLSTWSLEQLAEGSLPSEERRMATRHIESCSRCRAELESVQNLFEALSEMPRFAPSAGFNEAVMARITLAPKTSLVPAWLRRWLPSTGRGWAILTAAVTTPVLPLLTLLVWLLSKPLVSTQTLWIWGSNKLTSATQGAWSTVIEAGIDSGVFALAGSIFEAATSVHPALLLTLFTIFAIAIPLSVWSLVRLARSPMGQANYAN